MALYSLSLLVYGIAKYCYNNYNSLNKSVEDYVLLKKDPIIQKYLLTQNGLFSTRGLKPMRFGNRNAKVELTLVLSFNQTLSGYYLQECVKLLDNNPRKFRLSIVYLIANINTEGKDIDEKVVDSFIYCYKTEGEQEAILKQKKWFSDNSMKILGEVGNDIKYNFNDIHKSNYDWCFNNEVLKSTPLLLINGFIKPSRYGIQELSYFINYFEEFRIPSFYTDDY
ncbi:hypothetical protein GCM10009430_32020 [Aquimarina litoralis]|uniref:Thioredoxin-like fold domain-containing protein n=1 Tax=Aquimarina litoralis TaxID=584605 RepID=A0ABN1J1F3_9FLAO